MFKPKRLLKPLGIDHKEDKKSRLLEFIDSNRGKIFKPTPMAKKIGWHFSTLENICFVHDAIKHAGDIELILDEKKEKIMIIKIPKKENPKKILTDIKDTLNRIEQRLG